MLCPRKNCKPGAVGVMLPNIEGKVSGNGNIAYCCSPQQALLSMITLKKCYEYYFKAGYFQEFKIAGRNFDLICSLTSAPP